MGDTLLYVNRNHAAQVTAVLKTPLPAEDADYPASNMLLPDRTLVYSCPTDDGSATVWFIDIGAGRTVEIIGLLGYDAPGTAAITNFVRFRHSSVYPGSGGDWSNVGSPIAIIPSGIMPPRPDPYEILSTPSTKRYWEITLDYSFYGFSIGKTLLGELTDLGIAYSIGSTATLERSVKRQETVGRRPVFDETGPPRWMLSMEYASRTAAQRDELLALAYASPLAIVHPIAGLVEVDLKAAPIPVPHQFKGLFGVSLEAEQLP